MALGDGSAWDETTPVDGTTIITGDDHIRDLRIGIRSGMAFEHEWPSSQSATSERGKHKFITLQNQATKPTVSGTQVAAVYCKTSALYFEDTAGVEVLLTNGTQINVPAGGVVKSTMAVYATYATGTGTFALAATPNIGSGVEFMTVAYTPTNTANIVRITTKAILDNSANGIVIGAIFNGAVSTAIGADLFVSDNVLAGPGNIVCAGTAAITTTGAVSYSFRAGNTSSLNILFNGGSGAAVLGTTPKSFILVEEIKV